MQLDAENAISFITASVRIPTDWHSPLLVSDKLSESWPRDALDADDEDHLWTGEHLRRGDEQELWEIQTYRKLCTHFSSEKPFRACLLSLEELADRLRDSFPAKLKTLGVAPPLVRQQPDRRRGLLDYHNLQWLDSPFFPMPKADGENPVSTVIAFRPPGLPDCPPWREYLYHVDTDGAAERYEELAAVYDVIGLFAQRRSLISVTAQRKLCKIVLPWGRCRFTRHDGTTSREYLLVPVITLLNRRATSQFQPTLTLTVFLLPHTLDPAPAMDAADLAALCQQAVWNDQSPAHPVLRPLSARGPALFHGPLESFVRPFLRASDRHLPVVFDAILRSILNVLEVSPTTLHKSQSVRTLVAISRARSVVFGSTLHVYGEETSALWNQLTGKVPGELAQHVGKLLSVNAARHGREELVGGPGFRLDRMRVTNRYEEDTNTIVLYNPMSRFMVNIMPRSLDRFPMVSLKLGVAWLNLLAGTVSSLKEVLRSYRYEIEQYRNRIEPSLGSEDPADLLKLVHKTTLTIMEEVDVVYAFDLVTPTYKAAHSSILEMEGIGEERHNLMRQLEMTTALLRSEEADQLSKKIARSTSSTEKSARSTEQSARSTEESARSTDDLTKWVVAFTVVSTILAVNTLIESGVKENLPAYSPFWIVLGVDAVLLLVALLALRVYFRKKHSRQAAAASERDVT